MRILVLNHTYAQDLDSLRYAAGDDVRFRELQLDLLHPEAMRVLPADIDDGPEMYSRPEYEPHRRALAGLLERLFEDLYREWAFDVFVSPSDVFTYLREAVPALHRLGVPFLVAERETTVSPHIMDANVELMSRYFPPIADHRTLCSERLREFWVRAGAPPERVTVTGQPRYDFYRQPERWPERLPWGSEDDPTVLFLSYDYNAYHPGGDTLPNVWEKQHRETEEGLWELARRGWRVLFKPHPQQAHRDDARWRAGAGDLLGKRVFLIPGLADTRELVVKSDVVVGFQTTTLFETMVARRPIVYAGWDAGGRAAEGLIRYREWPDVLTVVDCAEDFVDAVEAARGVEWDEARVEAARGPVEENIGIADGRAGERTLATMRRVAEEFAADRPPEVRERRARLERMPPPVRLRRRSVYGYRRMRRRVGALLGR